MMANGIRRGVLVAVLVAAIGAPSFAAAQARGSANAKAAAEEAEYRAYRLTLPVLTRIEAATKEFASTIKSDPAYRAFAAAVREHRRLEEKDDRTDAEEARMEALKKQIDANPFGGASEGEQSLDELEAEIRKMAPMAKALAANNVTPRDYAKFTGILIQSYIAAAAQEASRSATDQAGRAATGLLGGLFATGIAPENLAFVKANRAAVERFMETMQELGEP